MRTDGTLWAWGNNASGQLGTGTTASQLTPVQVGTATNWQSVAAGGAHAVGLRTDGTLWSWGAIGAGQLTPSQVGTATNWSTIVAGTAHIVATRIDGSMWAWGINSSSQLGLGTTVNQNAPVQVGSGATWQSAAAGEAHTLAVRTDGTLWAWGNNTYGQTGQSNANPNPVNIPYPLISLATTFAVNTPDWQLFPNPAHGQVQLMGLTGPVAVQIFDAQGRFVRSVANTTLALDGLASGLYLIRATTVQNTQTLRLVVE